MAAKHYIERALIVFRAHAHFSLLPVETTYKASYFITAQHIAPAW